MDKVNAGEWTPYWLDKLISGLFASQALKVICERHNAALAEEREKVKELADELEQERNLHLQAANAMHLEHLRQLAAEREIKSAEKQILLDEIAKNKTLVDALKEVTKSSDGWKMFAIANAALKKVGK